MPNIGLRRREFEVGLEEYIGAVPDISRITQPLNASGALVEEATDSLDKYSRSLGRNPNGRGSIEAHILLPERLWHVFPSPEMDSLREWGRGIINTGGLCPVEAVVERLEGAVPEKIGKRQLTDAADALARLSVGMAPDPRFALRSPKSGEPVVLFNLPEGVTRLEAVSDKYKSILVSVAIGNFVAQADESVSESEFNALTTAIDRDPDLPDGERSRLKANLRWMMVVRPDLSLLRRHLRNAPFETSHQMGQIALSIAASDGVISGQEVAALERLYTALGLETGGIYSALHTLTSADDPLTVIPPAEGQPGFTIPPRPDPERALSLDADRVAAVMANTARVSALLNDIFQEEEPAEERGQPENGFGGLDQKHAAFLGELISRPHWGEEEYRRLARQFRLLPEGAMETVNEWSHERFGDLLIEEDDGFLIHSEVKDGNPGCGGVRTMERPKIRPRERDAIVRALSAGVVPRVGLQHIQVGRSREIEELLRDMDRIAEGGSTIRFIIGDYGSGKTFFLNLVRQIAMEKRMVVMSADISPDRRLHATGGQARSLYAEMARNTSTLSRQGGGAMPSVVERFATEAVSTAEKTGQDANSVIREKLAHLQEMVGGYDFATVIFRYWEGYDDGNEDLKSAALRWLRGEYSTRTEARRDLGVRTIVDGANLYDQLKLVAGFAREAGYQGVVVSLDEMVNLYKLVSSPGEAVQLRADSPHPERRTPGHRKACRVSDGRDS